MRRPSSAFAFALLAAMPAPLLAEVVEVGDGGFTVSHAKAVPVAPDKVWAALATPGRWWASGHSWSGDAANMTLDLRPGGCFCEIWKDGAVEHGRVIHASRHKLLRLRGSLGPLQGEALTGTLSFSIKPEGAGSRITAEYVVGGHARFPLRSIAPGVDGVIGEQLERLAKLLGG